MKCLQFDPRVHVEILFPPVYIERQKINALKGTPPPIPPHPPYPCPDTNVLHISLYTF